MLTVLANFHTPIRQVTSVRRWAPTLRGYIPDHRSGPEGRVLPDGEQATLALGHGIRSSDLASLINLVKLAVLNNIEERGYHDPWIPPAQAPGLRTYEFQGVTDLEA